MRSESCTFIWHPKVLMQAVLAAGSARPALSLQSGMGAVFVVLLILFLRLVDSRSEGDLPRTALEPQLFDLHVPGSRRPPEYIRNARTFLLPKFSTGPPSRAPTALRSLTPSSRSPPATTSTGRTSPRNILCTLLIETSRPSPNAASRKLSLSRGFCIMR